MQERCTSVFWITPGPRFCIGTICAVPKLFLMLLPRTQTIWLLQPSAYSAPKVSLRDWYWLADLCDQENMLFVLGHALYMKLIHGTKSKNDKNDSLKIARLLRGGNYPLAYVYPAGMRATRDLMRRRNFFVRKRAQLVAHIQNTVSQYNLPQLGKLARPHHRRDRDIAGHFPDPVVQIMIQANLDTIDHFDPLIKELDKQILALAKQHDPTSLIAPTMGTRIFL
ncbi:MAG: transposase [Balneolaceae bacterium]|nr:MAG: transposase [Balneolaceae bacterium]